MNVTRTIRGYLRLFMHSVSGRVARPQVVPDTPLPIAVEKEAPVEQ
jgi:hypothetical protein